ncbi:oligosaccharide flippase family protein [Chromatiaceae bacterium AAb-1]|nr:oligosaccharide flippase family protein [Chromatiaceae bacterium AAb-1]
MLLSNTVKYLPSQILAPLSQFLSIILWTYFGDESLIGYITLITAFQELSMAMFVNWWMHYSMREYGDFRKQGQLDRYWQTSRTVITVSCVLMIAASLLNLYFFVDQNADAVIFLLVAVYSLFRCLNNFNASIASLDAHILRYSVLTTTGPFIGLFIGVFLLKLYGPDPRYPLLGYVAGEILAALLVYRRSKLLTNIRWKPDRRIVSQALRYGLPMIGSALCAWLIIQYPRYFIAETMSLEQVGLYAVGVGLGLRIASLITMVVTPAALPLLYKIAHEQGEEKALIQLQNNLLLLLGVLLPGLLGLYAVSSLLIPLLIEPRFVSGALMVMPWALLAGGIEAVKNGYLNHLFFIRKKTRAILVYDAVMALLTIIFCWFLVQAAGIAGGAMASALALGGVISSIILFQYCSGRIQLPLLRILKITLAACLMYLLIEQVQLAAVVPSLLAKIAAGILSYFTVIAVLFRQEITLLLHQRKAGRN